MKTFILTFLFLVLICSCNDRGHKSPQGDSAETTEISTQPLSQVGKDFMVDDQHSYVGFKIKYFGFSPVRGRFNKFNGTLFYDTSDVSSLSVSVFIDVKSINTGNEKRDQDLISESSWFNADKHQYLSFQSKKGREQADGSFILDGILVINGVSKNVSVDFDKPTVLSTDWAGNEQVDFSGKLTINRQDFNVYGGDFWSSVMENGLTQLSDEVEIELDIHTRRPNYITRYEDSDSTDIRRIILDFIKSDRGDKAIEFVDSLHRIEKLSSGMLSTIGYTLNAWKMYPSALNIFQKRMALFPNKPSSLNQIGITNMYMKNFFEAEQKFKQSLTKDSTDSRAEEYLRLLAGLDLK